MVIDIRTSTLADLAQVDALQARTYRKLLKADYPLSVLVMALPVISRARPELLSCKTYCVAEEERVIFGVGGWTRGRKDHRHWYIRHVVTDDRLLRRRINRALLEHCIVTARQAVVAELECWSTLTAEGFYSALGFDVLGGLHVQLAGGISFPSVRMLRALSWSEFNACVNLLQQRNNDCCFGGG